MFFRRISQISSSGLFRRHWRRLNSCGAMNSMNSPIYSSQTPRALGFYSSAYVACRSSMSPCTVSMFNNVNSSYNVKGCFSTHAIADLPADGIVDIPLAQTGEGIAECELLKWFVKEGDQVEEFQPVCEVQSDKATIVITSRYEGNVFQILHAPGDIVKVGEALLKMVVGKSFASTQTSAALDIEEPLDPDVSKSDNQSLSSENICKAGVLSTPSVRSLAKQYGIAITDVVGSGIDGRVLKEDILDYAAKKGLLKETLILSGSVSAENLTDREGKYPDDSEAHGLVNDDKIVLLRGFQRAMVKSMTMAAKIPHFHYVEEINCDALMDLKASFQNENSDPNVKYTFLPILIKSLSKALSKYPSLNSCFNEELYQVTLKGSHNIGIAMATPHGLVVPNIKNVQSLSILQITKELSRLQQLALSNKLGPDDISGGTISLSNIGAIGGRFGSPLINPPEVSIIAMGRIQNVPRFADDGTVFPMPVMTVNVAADHRVLDGATVAKFCNEWKLLIEKPDILLLNMK